MRDPESSNVRIVIAPELLRKLGARAVELINIRTLEGIDAEGKKFVGYSTRPFCRPYAGVPKTTINRLEAEGSLSYFTVRGKDRGALWIRIEDGYLEFKRARNPAWNGVVDLHDTGEMMRNLSVTGTGASSVTIGFKTFPAAQKAYWHNVSGAGRSHVIRKFLGISPKDMTELIDLIQQGITVQF